ncbi:response regulator transcription factor [Jatrophihabitans telluris]|uniref:Sensory transduction protein RegX3 n=1 Tax=Jatrophihabitans telluris TaxID=2038343 RepID=A0ABY4QTS8_9ACTN|nr:response regulator transcription factor [Jatrophihabitans telluris]UQX86744.1 response regulator transcription factor [Jatrophihabitans telluris]
MRLLMVEDDDRVAAALRDILIRHGFTVTRAAGMAEALEAIDETVEVVLLDLGLPDGDGFDLCSSIRALHDVPILITTARADLRSRVHGLHMGADDYLVKPYAVSELLARIHAVTRRSRVARQSNDSAGRQVRSLGLVIDLGRRVVRKDGRELPLTRKEFGILEVLASERGLVVRRERLLSQVWGSSWGGDQHTLDVHVAAVRSKCGTAAIIETVRGIGYRLGGV